MGGSWHSRGPSRSRRGRKGAVDGLFELWGERIGALADLQAWGEMCGLFEVGEEEVERGWQGD